MIEKITLENPTTKQIFDKLSEEGYVVLKGTCKDEPTCKELVKNLNAQVLELAGQKMDKGHIKFIGHWVDMEYSSGLLNYYYMLAVV